MTKPDRAQISATVPPDIKAALTARAADEDRTESAVVKRALTVYLALDLDEAEQVVRGARNGKAEG